MDQISKSAGLDAATRGRDSLFLMATLRLGQEPGSQDVRIRNLSVGGLMAELATGAIIGTAVSLEMRGIGRITGRVAWSTDGRIGIAFDHPIDPKRARKPVGGGAGAPFYAKNALR